MYTGPLKGYKSFCAASVHRNGFQFSDFVAFKSEVTADFCLRVSHIQPHVLNTELGASYGHRCHDDACTHRKQVTQPLLLSVLKGR